MSENKIPIKSLRMTAALYATRQEVVEYVKEHGTLPQEIKKDGFPAAFGYILHHRGVDLELTEREQLVFDAILRSGRLPAGMVRVVEEMCDDEEAEENGAA